MKPPAIRHFPLLLPMGAIVLTVLSGTVVAGQVFWALNSSSPNLQSDGRPLTAATRFQLGVFTGGFTPGAGNVSDWTAHWRSWDEIQYDPTAGSFSKEVIFDENPAPFTESSRLYCWAYLATSTGQSEYFLVTDSTWLIPGTDPLAFPVFVDLETAGSVILGAVHPDSRTITTAAVTTGSSPPFFFVDWRRAHFTPAQRLDPGISGPEADPDGDGSSNLREYLTGTLPLTPDPNGQTGITAGAGGTVTISFSSPPSARAGWAFETSASLTGWIAETGVPTYGALTEMWRISPQIPAGETHRFWRLRALSATAP